VGHQRELSYLGSIKFCKLPLAEPEPLGERAFDVAIVGAPSGDAVSHGPGARIGPRAIRAATYLQDGYSLQFGVDIREQLGVADARDADVVPSSIERDHAMIYERVRRIAAAGSIPAVLGGDHSISWAAVSAPRGHGRAIGAGCSQQRRSRRQVRRQRLK
jgi:agmatinase